MTLWDVGAFFFKVGTFIFDGGLSMLAFMQEQVVDQFGWLTPQELVDGLALGQLTPGPILILAAFIGYKLFGVLGAVVATGAIFLPSFVMLLSILPLLRRMKDLLWLKAFMCGGAPAVIGALGVSVVQMAPHAAPDIFTWGLLGSTITIALFSKLGPLPLMAGGAWISVLAQNMGLRAGVSGIDRTAEVDRRLKQAAPLRGVNRSSCRASSLATAAGPRHVP